MKKIFQNNCLVFLSFLFFGGLLSSVLKYELLWDFANYHYYNPWAFLTGRFNDDPVVAGLNTFLNPLADIPLYLMIKYFNDFPSFIYFMQGLWFGALAFVFFKIVCLFFDEKNEMRKTKIFLVMLIALSGYAVFFQIGTSTNEIMISVLVFIGLWLLLNEIFNLKTYRSKVFFLSGFVIGAAVGLKYTAGIYALALWLTLLFNFRIIDKPIKNILFFCLGGLLGFLVFNGYWLWLLWKEFDNPFFPFFNAYFQSPYAENINYRDMRFIAKDWLHFCLLPFYWMFHLYRAEGEVFVIDWRLGLACICIFIWGIIYLQKKIQGKTITFRKINVFLFGFVFVSYAFWLSLFSIVRYMIVIEMFAAILIVATLYAFLPQKKIYKDYYHVFIVAIVSILLMTPLFSQIWGCRDCDVDGGNFEKFVEVKGVEIPDNSLLLLYNYPTSALAAYFGSMAENIQAINVKQQNYLYTAMKEDYFNENSYWKQLKEKIYAQKYDAQIAFIAAEPDSLLLIDKKNDPFLRKMICRKLENNIYPYYEMCAYPEIMKKILSKK